MDNWKIADDVIKFAIGEEQAACDFYISLSEKTEDKVMRDIFLEFAGEELGHRKKLENVKAGNDFFSADKNASDLKISDYLVDSDTASIEAYQDALLVAANKEKAAFRLYTYLSEMVSDADIKELFRVLAREEALHKLRFEIAYDDLLEDN